VAVLEVRWVKGGIHPADGYIFSFKMEMLNYCLGIGFFFVHKGNTLAGKVVEFISDRILYITMKGWWCDYYYYYYYYSEYASKY
jgi:hypothetical protein